MKFLKICLAVVGLLAALIVAGPAPAQAAPYCGITWGSLAKSADGGWVSNITNVRAGRHACFDRLVVDIRGHATGYNVEYVSSVARPGSGMTVPLRGGAYLRVGVQARTYNESGPASYQPANPAELVNTNGYATFRQIALAGSFEGRTTFGLGVRARLPFRVFMLYGPGDTTRFVVDVAHRW